MNKAKNYCAVVIALSSIAPSAQATLYDRGDGMIYDGVLNVTWLQQIGPMYDAYGIAAWANNLTYGGFSDWRAPSAQIATWHADNTPATFFGNGELYTLFVTELGNTAGSQNASFIDGGTGETRSFFNVPFNDQFNGGFWYGETYNKMIVCIPDLHCAEPPEKGIFFSLNSMSNVLNADPYYGGYGLAVRNGDVLSTVPIPGAMWLFASAVLGIFCIRRNPI